jgi:hypothetical protein
MCKAIEPETNLSKIKKLMNVEIQDEFISKMKIKPNEMESMMDFRR